MPYELLSLAPILLLIVAALSLGIRLGVWVSLVLTVGLFFYWGAEGTAFGASLVASLVATFQILLIVTGALLFFKVMEAAGFISQISESIASLTQDPSLRFFLMAMGFTAFFEGVAGFGTPGALVPPLLVAMGYPMLLSVTAVLLFDGVFAAFGALGTPLLAGMQVPLGLEREELLHISVWASLSIALAGLWVLAAVLFYYRQSRPEKPVQVGKVLLLYAFFVLGMVALSFFNVELPSVVGGLVLFLGAALFFRSKGFEPKLKPWLPYLGFVLLILLPNFSTDLSAFLKIEIGWEDLMGTEIDAKFAPLRSPFVPFALVALAVWWWAKKPALALGELGNKTFQVSLVLFPSIAVSNCMLHSGNLRPSMVVHIAELFSQLGAAYPVFASLVGALGTFVTGSSTVSNILFGASQEATASALALDPKSLLTLQHLGASLGNAICLFNIIAATAVVGMKKPKEVLLRTLVPILLLLAMIGLVAWFFV